MSDTQPERTPAEQAIIEQVSDHRGKAWAEEHAELILTQARLVEEL